MLDAAAVPEATDQRVQTEFCIDTTCRRAISLGYAATLVADGHGTSDSGELPASQIVAHHNRTLNEYGAYVGQRVCEIIVAPADSVQFDRARDVPSSLEGRPLG